MPEATLYEINNLLMQVGEGSEQAFRTVFDLYKKRFYVASLKMTHSRDMAEEIVQEVFVTLWIKRAQVACRFKPRSLPVYCITA
jgi:RNA polymerase sigma-70 factor (ECF subfamily)